MPSKPDLQLYADECFPLTTVVYLRSLGFSIKHASEFNFLGKSDLQHLKNAQRHEKTLITLDRDFLGYTQSRVSNTCGVIIIQAGAIAPKHVNLICRKQLKRLTKHSIKNSLTLVTIDKITKG